VQVAAVHMDQRPHQLVDLQATAFGHESSASVSRIAPPH
jgi:hypothetical protein